MGGGSIHIDDADYVYRWCNDPTKRRKSSSTLHARQMAITTLTLIIAALVRGVHGLVACTYIGVRIERLYDRTEFEYGVCRNQTGVDIYLADLSQVKEFKVQSELVLDLAPVAYEDLPINAEPHPSLARPLWTHYPYVGYSIRKVVSSVDPPASKITSSNSNCYARACGSKKFLHVIMSYTNKGPTRYGMGTVAAVTEQTYTATENIAGMLAASSYGLLTVEQPPVSRVELLDMGSNSATGAVFCSQLLGSETLRAISILNAAEIDTSTSAFDVIEFIFPGDTGCWLAGQAEQDGQRSWVDNPTFQSRSHEIGHTMGMVNPTFLPTVCAHPPTSTKVTVVRTRGARVLCRCTRAPSSTTSSRKRMT